MKIYWPYMNNANKKYTDINWGNKKCRISKKNGVLNDRFDYNSAILMMSRTGEVCRAARQKHYGLLNCTKAKVNSTRRSQAVSHPSNIRAQRCLTSVIGREPVLSTWYGRWHLHKHRHIANEWMVSSITNWNLLEGTLWTVLMQKSMAAGTFWTHFSCIVQ